MRHQAAWWSAIALGLACGHAPGDPSTPTMECARRHDLAAWRGATAELRGDADALRTLVAVDIAASKDTTCAIDRDGALWCWGALGGLATPIPRRVELATPSRAITGTDGGFCLVQADGSIICLDHRMTPTPLDLTASAAAVVMGDRKTLVRLDDGRYVCVGACDRNRFVDVGEVPVDLADGDQICLTHFAFERFDGGACAGDRRHVLLGPTPRLCGDGRRWRDGCDADVVERATTQNDGCELAADGAVRCVGAYARRLVDGGMAEKPPLFDPRVLVPLRAPATRLVGGSEHLCALDREGRITCWGDNRWGQVGLAPIGDEVPPRTIQGFDGIVALAAGGTNHCALDREGVLWCWGAAPTIGRDRDSLCEAQVATPIAVGRFDDAAEIAVGHEEACVRGHDGSVRCVGWFEGRRPRDDLTRPRRRRPVADISHGEDLCVLHDDYVTCRAGPQTCMSKCNDTTWLKEGGELVEIDGHCARTAANEVACWALWPLKVFARYADPILQIRASGVTWCVLLADGAVSCEAAPDERIQGHQFVDLSVGERTACAVTRGGEVACWRLFDDDWRAIWPATPEIVPGVRGATAVAVGERAICSLLDDQRVICWGGDHDGELARGYLPYALDPLEVLVPAGEEAGS